MADDGRFLGNVPNIVIIVVIIALMVGVGALVVGKVRDTFLGSYTNIEHMNDTFAEINDSAEFAVTNSSYVSASWRVINGSNLEILNETTDYNVNETPTLPTFTFLFNSTDGARVEYNTTISRDLKDVDYNVTQTGLDAISDLSDYQTTWVAVIGAIVLLGMLGAFFVFSPRMQ